MRRKFENGYEACRKGFVEDNENIGDWILDRYTNVLNLINNYFCLKNFISFYFYFINHLNLLN